MADKQSKKSLSDHVAERDGYAEVTLSRPASINGVKTSVVRMREPTAGDQEAYQDSTGSEAKREITIFANLCEASPDDIRALPLRDYARLQVAYALFTN